MSVKFKKYPHFHITAISMIRFLTIWFVLCTWLAPVTEHAQAQEIKKLLFGSIVSACTVDSLKDGIVFTISVNRRMLRNWKKLCKDGYKGPPNP